MFKTKIEDIKGLSDNSRECDTVSLSQYRERRNQIKSVIDPDKNPLPPCAMAMAA